MNYLFKKIIPDNNTWRLIESCYDATVDKTKGIIDYCEYQGCKPFVAEIHSTDIKVCSEDIQNNSSSSLIGWFVGGIIWRVVPILGSPNEGLGIAHQGLSMLYKVSSFTRLQIYSEFSKWIYKHRYAMFIQVEDFQLEMDDVDAYNSAISDINNRIIYQGHDCSWIDLTKTEEELFHGMDYKSCRYMINKAIKNQICVREATDADSFLGLHFKQHLEVMKRHNQFAAKPKKNIKALIESTWRDSLMLLEAVDAGNRIVSTGIFVVKNNNCHFFSRACFSSDLSSGANELLMWEAIKRSKARGALFFNNSGVGPFKLKFGSIRRYKPRLFFPKYKWLVSARTLCFEIFHKYRKMFSIGNNIH